MIISIAWRNVWRNKLRSLVVIIAITLGICAGVFATAFMKGLMDQRIESAIESEVSHIQLHKPEYLQDDRMNQYIPEASAKAELIKQDERIAGVSKRLSVNAMITTAGKGSGVKLSGILPEDEEQVTNIHEKMVKGEYFGEMPGRIKPVIMGAKLAEKLNAKIKSRVVLQFADVNGNPVSIGCRLMGIYKTENSAFDETHVFLKYEDVRQAMDVPENSAHEIAVLLNQNDNLEQVEEQIASSYEQLEVSTWKEVSPELSYLSEMMDQYMYIIIVIILLALLFGIINTMLMAVLERVKELGMLMAIGMNKRRVFSMIMMESVFLAFTGGIAGVLLGYGATLLLGYFGMDLSLFATGLEAMGWSTIVYPSIELDTLLIVTIMVIVTGIISAIYPAIKALRLNPAESIRTE